MVAAHIFTCIVCVFVLSERCVLSVIQECHCAFAQASVYSLALFFIHTFAINIYTNTNTHRHTNEYEYQMFWPIFIYERVYFFLLTDCAFVWILFPSLLFNDVVCVCVYVCCCFSFQTVCVCVCVWCNSFCVHVVI